MVLVELPVTFKDLRTMMEIFKREDPGIGSYIVEMEGDNLVLNPPFHDENTKN